MNRKIVGTPGPLRPIGTKGALWGQNINGIEVKVFQNTYDYANGIIGVEGEYEYWPKPNQWTDKQGRVHDDISNILVDPNASRPTKGRPQAPRQAVIRTEGRRETDIILPEMWTAVQALTLKVNYIYEYVKRQETKQLKAGEDKMAEIFGKS